MTARPRASRWSTSPAAARGRSARSGTSSGARRSTGPGPPSTRCAWIERPGPTSGSGAVRSMSSAPAVRILDPIAPDARFGRTFSTEFMWDLDGERLAVQSCGEFACRTRLIDPRGGVAQMLDEPDLGLLVGVDGDSIVTYADCRGLPCPIVSTDIATGERRTVADAAGAATLIATDDGPRLVHETPTEAGGRGPVRPARRIRRSSTDRRDPVRRPPGRDAAVGRVGDARARRMGAPRAGRPPSDRPDRPPPAAPPHPGRHDRPAR